MIVSIDSGYTFSDMYYVKTNSIWILSQTFILDTLEKVSKQKGYNYLGITYKEQENSENS